MATVRNYYQKRLDRTLQSWYNTRTEQKKVIRTMEETIKRRSTNPKQSQLNLETLFDLAGGINSLGEQKRYANLRTPVIAGGAIRDTAFGLPPNDWDIFLDVTSVEQAGEEPDDFVLLYLSDLMEVLRKRSERFRVRLNNAHVEALVGQYTGDDERQQWEGKQFIVYQNGWSDHVEWPMNPIKVQAIGRSDTRLTDDPVSFLDEFDYGAVKALYDPKDMQFKLHDDFKEFLDTKKIVVKDNKTGQRVRSFSDRFWPNAAPFKIIDERPITSTDAFTTIMKQVKMPNNFMNDMDFIRGRQWDDVVVRAD